MQQYHKVNNYLGDCGQLDAFGRLRTSEIFSLFESKNLYNKQPLFWNEITSGTATITHQGDEASVLLSIGTAENDRAVRQTKTYFRYQTGKSQLIKMTGIIGVAKAGVTKLIGYGDDNNGLFFGQDGDGLYMMVRSKATSSVVDTKIYQSSWNTDRVDGSKGSLNDSHVNFDVTTAALFGIDFEWLGVGRIRFGFYIKGTFVPVHQIDNINALVRPYIATPNLPLRYEIVNTAATASTTTLTEICSAISSEGGQPEVDALPSSLSRTAISVTTSASITMAIRSKATLNSIVNRILVPFMQYQATTASNNMLTEVLYDFSTTGSPTWTSVDDNSGFEHSTDIGTGFSGGTVIYSLIVTAGQGSSSGGPLVGTMLKKLPVVLDQDGANPILLGLRCTGIGGTATASLAFNWAESY